MSKSYIVQQEDATETHLTLNSYNKNINNNTLLHKASCRKLRDKAVLADVAAGAEV